MDALPTRHPLPLACIVPYQVSVSVDKAGDATFGEIAVHVLHMTDGGATQVGSKEGQEVVLATEYVDTESAKGSFHGQHVSMASNC